MKYETPGGARMALDVHPRTRTVLGDPAVPLVITEGVLKADSVFSHGVHAVALLGVWNFRGTNSNGGKAALADWESVALNGRLVYLLFDSDAMRKRQVHAALERLWGFLESRQAVVRVCYLEEPDGEKVGIDDYLASGGGLEELLDAAESSLREPPADRSEQSENPRTDGEPASLSEKTSRIADPRTIREAANLASERDILACFRRDLRLAGVAGEERGASLTFLSLVSRVLPWGKPTNRPVSAIAKGTTSSGSRTPSAPCCASFPRRHASISVR